MADYDYSQAGAYFITICCEKRIHCFEEIENNEMILNVYGIHAYNEHSYQTISENIVNQPKKWGDDKFYYK
ncbi:hypothetical protein [uncultured Cyclobacterium sp.]|uniref:hypothetical protein n=1 Tax=uncultured Cyclobacterium sp. TaxID=453820 RepID=UPI0030EEF791